MNSREFKELEKRVRTLERLTSAERTNALLRSSSSSAVSNGIYNGVLTESIEDLYSVVLIEHNQNQNRLSQVRKLDENTVSNANARYVPGIALNIGNVGDSIEVQTQGVQFAAVNNGANSYGSDNSIKAGDNLTVSSTSGVLARKSDDDENETLFSALESAHTNENLLLVKFAAGAGSGQANNMFLVKLTSPFPTGYRCDVFENGDDQPATILDQFATTVDGVVTGLPLNISFWAMRFNTGTPSTPFFTYKIIHTRWM